MKYLEHVIATSQRQISKYLKYVKLSTIQSWCIDHLNQKIYIFENLCRLRLNQPQFAIRKCLKVHIPYSISSSKDCDDDKKHDGITITIIILHALPVKCASMSLLPHAHIQRTISYRAIQLHINHARYYFAQRHVMTKNI